MYVIVYLDLLVSYLDGKMWSIAILAFALELLQVVLQRISVHIVLVFYWHFRNCYLVLQQVDAIWRPTCILSV